MQLIQTFLAATLAASVLAIPLDDNNFIKTPRDVLEILESRAATTAVDCKGAEAADHHDYAKDDVKKSYDAGRKNVKTEDCTAKNDKVKVYGASDSKVLSALPSECKNLGSKGKLFEYRIQGSDTDRVVWACHKAQGKVSGSSDFCLVMTHRGQSENQFKPCEKK